MSGGGRGEGRANVCLSVCSFFQSVCVLLWCGTETIERNINNSHHCNAQRIWLKTNPLEQNAKIIQFFCFLAVFFRPTRRLSQHLTAVPKIEQ